MKFRGTHETPQEIGHMRHPSVVEGYWTLVIPNSVSFPGPATRDSVATGATLAVAQSIVVTALLRGYSSMSPVFPPPGVDYRKAIQLLEESTAPSRGQWGIVSRHLSPFGRCISIGDHTPSLFSI